MPEDEDLLKSLSEKYEAHYKEELAALPKKYRNDFEELYKRRWANVKELFENKEIYTSRAAQSYLDVMVSEIVKGNSILHPVKFKCYFSRSAIPNASYIGEGIIIFNMGLFARLNNESEAAFILCHEIAHFYLQHSENSMRRYVEALNSKDVQNKLKKIKRSEYGKRQRVEDLVKNISFDFRRHGRDHESQADSMAVELMQHTKFDVTSSLTALALLDSVDQEAIDMDIYLQQVFNWDKYPFKERWVKKETGLMGGHATIEVDEAIADSLKTHPDCMQRIEMLEPLVNQYQSAGRLKNVINKSTFEQLKNNFSYEMIQFSYEGGNYTSTLFYTLASLQQKPGDPYLIAQIGRIFNSLYSAQKEHTLGKFIDLPAPYYPPQYNLLLEFVQNLYVEEYAAINYYFLNQHSKRLADYPPFAKAFRTSKRHFKK